MGKLAKALAAANATDKAVILLSIIQEPAVQKSWKEAARSTHAAVRETRGAWKFHKGEAWTPGRVPSAS